MLRLKFASLFGCNIVPANSTDSTTRQFLILPMTESTFKIEQLGESDGCGDGMAEITLAKSEKVMWKKK